MNFYFQNLLLNSQECLRRTSENEEKIWQKGNSGLMALIWCSVIILLVIQWPKETYEKRPQPVWLTKPRLFQHSRLSIPRWCIVDVSLSGILRPPNINGTIRKNWIVNSIVYCFLESHTLKYQPNALWRSHDITRPSPNWSV